MDEHPAPTGRDDVTTASDLVRRFRMWSDRAESQPVYISHRGRPRLVLASVEMIETLYRPRDSDGDDRASLDETFVLSRGAAVARIDRYGFLDGPHTALAALTGIGVSMLSSLRFVTLFSIQSRSAVTDLIAAVSEDGEPRSATAGLLTEAGDPRQVTVALAPRRRTTGIDGVVALILATN
ncbi:hypothetical protein FPZ24_06900 [Sphingomonas panacisoli]|uniref:Type II toxin-antitoxin system prevent-host-death family antitoxin n=1 Tax=Sphingomonas panacisoli TaxID=1813879 RepID=A0A5B8LJD6_9SPHN|nr:hypothetical protein [Sphingomonas panacisoli]QDZ07240.1 hypothetical protein FPZ24_06900 [Sphingomonas panacisoli]